MTYKITPEVLEALGNFNPDQFAKLVHLRITVLREYDDHEAIVRRHAQSPDMPDDERYVSLAVPAAPPEVDAAIRRTPRGDGTTEFTADYEIVGPSFERKKAALFQQVSEAETQAIAAIAPVGKLRAFQFREVDIRKADQERYNAALATKPDNIMAFDDFGTATRSEADTKFLQEQAAREQQRQDIMRRAAQLHSDIEDLTPETIDHWEMKSFNG